MGPDALSLCFLKMGPARKEKARRLVPSATKVVTPEPRKNLFPWEMWIRGRGIPLPRLRPHPPSPGLRRKKRFLQLNITHLQALPEAEEKIPIAEYHAPTPEGYVTPTGVLSATGFPNTAKS